MNSEPSSAEEAVELFLACRRRGERLDPTEFANRYAHLGSDLSEALDALIALEHAVDDEGRIPERIGPYRVLREIGRGGMGVVLEAIEEPLGRRVALKVLLAQSLTSSAARARFQREAELAARLDHSGIATVYGTGVEDGRPWIAMRFVEGRTLARAIAEARDEHASCARLRPADVGGRGATLAVAGCIAKVARALQAAHEQGVVHRDVKPSNIIVAPDGTPILVDFGLAIPEESDGHTLTRTGETAGTPAYIAPEIIGGERARPDAQSDVYALGVTLYECLTLRRPFEAPTPIALYRAILANSPGDARSLNRSITRDLAVVVATAMERDRTRRYANAAALAEDLEACVQGRLIRARPVPWHGRVALWARRDPRRAALASSLVLASIVAAVLAGSWWSSRAEVRAAAKLTRERAYEQSLQDGFGNLATNWHAAADSNFLRALAIDPHSVEAYAGRAIVCMRQHRDNDVFGVLKEAPLSPALDALRALAGGELPTVEENPAWFATASAVEMFVDGLRVSKQSERVPRHERPRLARIALSRFSESIARSKTARSLYHVQRALAAVGAGDESAMRSEAAALAVLWPDSERELFTAGAALSRIDPQAAIVLLDRAIALDPTWEQPYQSRSNALYSLHEFGAAALTLRRALELNPKDADAWNTLGNVLSDDGCPDEARPAYLRALMLRPSMFEAWANLGIMEVDSANFAAGEYALDAALALDPRENVCRLTLANALEQQGAPREAVAEIETVIGLDPRNTDGWLRLARLRSALDEHAEALRAAEVGLEIAPHDAQLGEALELARAALATNR